jgi:ubiquinone/menaquinone biosynthesis C-methylase UbiE
MRHQHFAGFARDLNRRVQKICHMLSVQHMADYLYMNSDPIARWYQLFEYLVFGRALQRRRLEFLKEVADVRSVLILGDGDGRFTAEFVKQNPQAVVESVDSSARMLQLAERRVGSANVQFRVGDARTIALSGKYDLVVTHFFLDCFTNEELDKLVERITGRCMPNARWLVSEFGLPLAGVPRFAARALIRIMYFFFRVLTGLRVTHLPNYAPVLARNGFQIMQRQTAAGGLLISELFRAQSDHRVDSGSPLSREPGGQKTRNAKDD